MRRRLNLRVLAILLVGSAVLAGGVHLLHGYQVRRNAGTLIEQADRAEQQGDLAEAATHLERYVTLVRTDAPAWGRLGLLLERRAATPRDHLKAFFVIEQALRLGPDQHEARRQLVRIAIDLRRHSDARDHLDRLLQTFPNDAELEDLQAQCAVAAAQFAQADQWWQRAVQHAPERIECWSRRAYLLRRRLNRPEEADQVMDSLVKANPKSAAAYLARGRYLAEFRDGKQAAPDIERALQLAPDDGDVLLTAADLSQARDRDAARAHLEHGIQKHPKDGRFLVSMARLELRAGRRTEAADYLQRATPLLTDIPARWTAADLFLDAGKPAEARKVLAQAEKGGMPRAHIDYLQARLQIGEQNWAEARKLLEGARQGLSHSQTLLTQANLLLALCYQHLGNPDLRLAACRAAVSASPGSNAARLALASATAATGRADEALPLYESLAAQSPTSRLAAGRLMLRRTLRQPRDQRKWAEIERFLKDAPAAVQKDVEWRLLWADVLTAQDRLDHARIYLEVARAQEPKKVEYRLALAALADRQKQPDAAVRLLDEADRDLGDHVELRLARAIRGSQAPKKESQSLVNRLSRNIERFAPAEQARLLDGLVLVSLRIDDIPLARQLADRLVKLQPHDLNSRFLAFRLALQAKDGDAGRRLLAELTKLEGSGGALAHYGEAALWVRFAKSGDKEGIAPARKHLAEAAKLRPSWPPVALLDAELCEREGNLDQAIDRYREAVTRGERQIPVVRRLVQLLHERRRYTEAEEVLRPLQEEAPLTGALGRLAAEVSLLSHRGSEQTLDLARQAVAANSKDYREQLWLGQVLAALDRRTEAEKAFRRAVELKNDVPDTWVNLVLFLARGKQTETAEKTLRDAQQKLGSAANPLALAVCWEALGKPEQAAQQYQVALKAKPEDPAVLQAAATFQLRSGRPAEAQPLLRKLLANQASADSAAWARRNLALSLAMTGNYPQFQEALGLVEQNLKKSGAGVQDQRAKALVLAMRPGHRRESIRMLEGSFTRLPASPEEQFLLARLYDADQNWPKARAQLLELLTATEAKNPAHLAYLVAALVRHDDLETAAHWLEQLEKLEPKSGRTTEVKARLLVRQEKAADAVRLIQEHSASQDAAIVLSAARLLEDLEQGEAAETMHRQWAKASPRPESALLLAEFLSRRGKLDEALATGEQVRAKVSLDLFATFCGSVARAKGITPKQQERVEAWLATDAKRQPKSATVHLALAQLREAQGRHADAQALYRKALALDPRNVMAANNLAVLLAHQQKGDEALELSRKAIELAGPLAPLLDTRGTAYLSAGQAKQALTDLEEAVSQHPTAPRYYHLARAHRAMKDRTAAQLAYQKAKKLGLNAAVLHPLERADYHKLRAEQEGK